MHWPRKVTDEKAAVWALGATMYEIILPFRHDLEGYIDAMEHLYTVMIRLESSDALRRIIKDTLTLSDLNRPSLIDLIKRLENAEKSAKNSRLKESEEANGKNEDPPMTLKDMYPSESWVNVRHSDGTISGGVVLDYHPEEDFALVGFGEGERGLDMKYIGFEDIILSKIDYAEGAILNDQPMIPYEIGTEVFIRRHSGAIEKGVVKGCTPTGKYIKVLSQAKTWKWFPRKVLEELQKKA
jgi:hypothetical protein